MVLVGGIGPPLTGDPRQHARPLTFAALQITFRGPEQPAGSVVTARHRAAGAGAHHHPNENQSIPWIPAARLHPLGHAGAGLRRHDVRPSRNCAPRVPRPWRPTNREAGTDAVLYRTESAPRTADPRRGPVPADREHPARRRFRVRRRLPYALCGGHLVFNADAAITLKGYRVAGADISAPRLFSDHLTLMGRGQYRYFPQEDYFGLGPGSEKAARSTYLLEERELGRDRAAAGDTLADVEHQGGTPGSPRRRRYRFAPSAHR